MNYIYLVTKRSQSLSPFLLETRLYVPFKFYPGIAEVPEAEITTDLGGAMPPVGKFIILLLTVA